MPICKHAHLDLVFFLDHVHTRRWPPAVWFYILTWTSFLTVVHTRRWPPAVWFYILTWTSFLTVVHTRRWPPAVWLYILTWTSFLTMSIPGGDLQLYDCTSWPGLLSWPCPYQEVTSSCMIVHLDLDFFLDHVHTRRWPPAVWLYILTWTSFLTMSIPGGDLQLYDFTSWPGLLSWPCPYQEVTSSCMILHLDLDFFLDHVHTRRWPPAVWFYILTWTSFLTMSIPGGDLQLYDCTSWPGLLSWPCPYQEVTSSCMTVKPGCSLLGAVADLVSTTFQPALKNLKNWGAIKQKANTDEMKCECSDLFVAIESFQLHLQCKCCHVRGD